ncbi:MAG: hypothetical protein H7068_05755, partial [Pedobacter sp.]|nr:hypothetical protein [Chitinophagaceae bacterium]
MNSTTKIGMVIIATIAITNLKLIAQQKPNYEVGINIGTLVYQGDLSATIFGSYQIPKVAVGLTVSKELDTYFALRASLLFGKIGADESKMKSPSFKQYRNFKFSTSVTELSTVLVWNILGERNDKYYRKIAPYVFAGAGLTFLNIKRDWSKINTSFFDTKSTAIIGLGIDTFHSTPKVLPIIPIGVGVNYAITNRIGIKAEATYRFTF